MYISADILLRGDIWNETLKSLDPLFSTHFEMFCLAASIGIHCDKQIQSLDTKQYGDDHKSIPRSILHNNKSFLDKMFQAAVLTSSCIDLDEDTRIQWAFDSQNQHNATKSDKSKSFNPLTFLLHFANYGIGELSNAITKDDLLDTMDNLATLVKKYAKSEGIA
ncbi:MAG: hypothetical protein FWD76_01615 [Firmicutes bacterium]|nr:hypothetical protein [Bacillota bacterium]